MPSRPIDVQAFLARLPLFRELREDEIERIALQTRRISASRGEVLFQAGDALSSVYVVVYGEIKLAFTSRRGAEKVVDIVGPGNSFGEAVAFLGRPCPVTAQALCDALILAVGRDALLAELERDKQFATRVVAGLSMRLHALVNDLESHSMHTGVQRVIGYLLRDCGTGESSGSLQVELPTTKALVASRLSLTQEHFSRILHELISRGLIEVDGRSIRVLDVERLRNFMP
jgi:CRP/FNR family transcriptional regulator, dissimilatory nitrate respiration regulator